MSGALVSNEKGSVYAIIAGFLTLITSAFLDNFRGPLLPIIQSELEFSYDIVSWFLIIGNLVGAMASLIIGPLLNRYSEKRLLVCSAVWTILVVCCVPFLSNLTHLLIFSAGLGVSIALLGTLCNILTISGAAKNQESRLVALLHVMYGVGSMIGPLALVQIRESFGWRYSAFFVLPFLVLVIALIVFSKISAAQFHRKYKSVHLDAVIPEQPVSSNDRITFTFPNRVQLLMLATFMFYVGAEVMTSMWMPPLLTKTFGFSFDQAANMAAGFFALLAFLRILCFLFLKSSFERKLLWLSLIIPLVSIILALVLKMPYILILSGFFGPFFPIYFVRVSKSYPEQWKQMSTWLIVALQLSLALCNFLLGKLSTQVSVEKAYLAVPSLIVLALVFLWILEKKTSDFYVS